MKTGTYTDSDGQILDVYINNSCRCYYVNSNYHRLDGPAIERFIDKSYGWWKNGKFHRIGGPAYFYAPWNSNEWWVNGRTVEVYYIYG